MAEEKIIEAKVQPKEYVVHARIVGWKPLGILDNHNYNKLFNKPSINGVELVGDKTLDELGVGDEIDQKIRHHNNDQDAHSVLYVNTKELTAELNDGTLPERNKLIETTHGIPAIRAWVRRLLRELENKLTGEESNSEDEITLWGIRNRADKYNKEVIGTESDSVDNVTVWGVRNRSDKHASDITGTENDPDTAKTLNGLFKRDASNYKTLNDKIDKTKDDLIGKSTDDPGAVTINGALNKATHVQNIILGSKADTGDKLSLYGLSKKVDDAQNAITGKSTDSEDDLTLNGLKKRIIIHGTDANKSIEDLTKMIDTNTKSIENVMGTDPDSTDDESIYGLRNNLYKLRKDTFGSQDDSSDVMTLNGITKLARQSKSDVVGTASDSSGTLTIHGLNNKLDAVIANVTGQDPKETGGKITSITEVDKKADSNTEKIKDIVGSENDTSELLTLNGLNKKIDEKNTALEKDVSDNSKAIDKNSENIEKNYNEIVSIKKNAATYGNKKLTLAAANWTGDNAPYVYDLGTEYASENVTIGFDGDSGTKDQLTAANSAWIVGGASSKIYAYGEKPTIDIPIVLGWIGGLNDRSS